MVVGGQGLRVAVTVGRRTSWCLCSAKEASQIGAPTITFFKIIPNSACGEGAMLPHLLLAEWQAGPCDWLQRVTCSVGMRSRGDGIHQVPGWAQKCAQLPPLLFESFMRMK